MRKIKLNLPAWANVLILLKNGFKSMTLDDLYLVATISRNAVFINIHALLDRKLIEVDNSHHMAMKSDNRKVYYVLTIPGFDCAAYCQKIQEIMRVSGTNNGMGVLVDDKND